MGCGCKSSTPGISTYRATSKKSTNINCTYTIEELETLLAGTENPNAKSYIKSQINVYNYNCNLFVPKINELLNIS